MSWRRRGLASAKTKAGEQLLGTRDVLVVPDPWLPGGIREIRWEGVLTAEWDSEAETLTLALVVPEILVFELVEPALLLQLVRERVTASIVLTRRVPTAGERGFTVMARRPPGGGEISVTYEYDRGVDPDSPDVRQAAHTALRDVRDELGL